MSNGNEIKLLSVDSEVTFNIDELFEAIRHGDEAHQSWLCEALHAFFKGEPMPECVPSKPSPPKMMLLGWRLDYPIPSIESRMRWAGADDWERKDRYVKNHGAVAVELYGDPDKRPSSGPPNWPVITDGVKHYKDEPIFTLLGRDPQAPELVLNWAEVRSYAEGFSSPKVGSAEAIAKAMLEYKTNHPDVGMRIEEYHSAVNTMSRMENDS